MNIPDEVLWEQFQTVYEPGSRTSFEYAQRDRPDVLDGIHAVAEWTRKEALREAALVSETYDDHRFYSDRIGAEWQRRKVADAIRELAEGPTS